MTYIVAITGGVASGKTTVTNLFGEMGVPIIDADIIAREVVEKGTLTLTKIAQHFGHDILLSDGSLNRALLRKKVFNQPKNKQWLNNLIHPLVEQETEKKIAEIKAPYVIWVSPLLIETGQYKKADRILVIDVDPKVQIARTISRDNIDLSLAKKMLNAQVSRKERLSYADDVIENNEKPEKLLPIVQKLHKHYLSLAAQTSNL